MDLDVTEDDVDYWLTQANSRDDRTCTLEEYEKMFLK